MYVENEKNKFYVKKKKKRALLQYVYECVAV